MFCDGAYILLFCNRYKLWVLSSSDLSDIKNWNFLKTGDVEYYLSLDDTSLSPLWESVMNSECNQLKNNCFLVKNDDWVATRLTNSWVAFENLDFTVMWDKIRKLAINFKIRPSTKKGIRTNLIKKSTLIFETTISERFVKTQ